MEDGSPSHDQDPWTFENFRRPGEVEAKVDQARAAPLFTEAFRRLWDRELFTTVRMCVDGIFTILCEASLALEMTWGLTSSAAEYVKHATSRCAFANAFECLYIYPLESENRPTGSSYPLIVIRDQRLTLSVADM